MEFSGTEAVEQQFCLFNLGANRKCVNRAGRLRQPLSDRTKLRVFLVKAASPHVQPHTTICPRHQLPSPTLEEKKPAVVAEAAEDVAPAPIPSLEEPQSSGKVGETAAVSSLPEKRAEMPLTFLRFPCPGGVIAVLASRSRQRPAFLSRWFSQRSQRLLAGLPHVLGALESCRHLQPGPVAAEQEILYFVSLLHTECVQLMT